MLTNLRTLFQMENKMNFKVPNPQYVEDLEEYSKRLADYVYLAIRIGSIKEDSPIGIAYNDFMEVWREYHNLELLDTWL